MSPRNRRAASACLGVLVLGTLSACTSTPGNRRVVSDVIESQQLPEREEQCMLDRLDGYSDDELSEIADENENWDPSSGDTRDEASAGMRAFMADFESCTGEGATGSSTEPTASSAASTPSAPATTGGA